jgi:hypothetical protein
MSLFFVLFLNVKYTKPKFNPLNSYVSLFLLDLPVIFLYIRYSILALGSVAKKMNG